MLSGMQENLAETHRRISRAYCCTTVFGEQLRGWVRQVELAGALRLLFQNEICCCSLQAQFNQVVDFGSCHLYGSNRRYWQDVFDPKNDWQVEFEGISTFIQNLPRSGPKRQSLLIAHSWMTVDQNRLSSPVPSGARLDVQMSEDGSAALGYLLSLAHVTGNNPPFPLLQSFNATLLTPACSTAGTAVIQWFNTSTGLATGNKATLPCSNGTVVFATPDLADDRAFLMQIDDDDDDV